LAGALEGVKRVVEFAHPFTMLQLQRAGALSPMTPVAIARSMPWLLGRGPSLGIISRMNATVVGDKPAVHDRDGTLTWKELDGRSNQVANALRDAGLRGDDRVGMLLRNGREMLELILGAQKLGIVACPMNTWAKPKELEATLEDAGLSLVVYDTAHSEQVEKAKIGDLDLLHVGADDDAVAGSNPYEDYVRDRSSAPPPPFTRDRGSAKVIIHTSGTTGKPKGASRDASATSIGPMAHVLSVVPYRRDDIVYCPAPLFHSFGLFTSIVTMMLGSTLVLPEKFDAQGSLEMIEKHGATAASFVPVMIKRILSLDDDVKSRYDLSSLRIVMASGSAMSPDLRKAAMDLFGDVLYDLYGSTEVGWVAIARPEDIRANPKSVGKPVPGTDIAVFTKDGSRAPAGEVGELFIKSDIHFEGYTSGESKEEREGYMSIGDLGRVDEDGFLFIEGRSDDMVVIGGENVYPIEVEEIIESIDGVSEASVLGVKDEEYGEVLAAFVVGDASEDQVVKTCKRDLASFKVPKRVERIDELPRTSTGKVLKRELIKSLEGAEELDD
jgi:acyl-CoA synthetase (AMP-forming)/AMP-acid ligase II